jgi:hypothetical protein
MSGPWPGCSVRLYSPEAAPDKTNLLILAFSHVQNAQVLDKVRIESSGCVHIMAQE